MRAEENINDGGRGDEDRGSRERVGVDVGVDDDHVDVDDHDDYDAIHHCQCPIAVLFAKKPGLKVLM